MKTGVEIIDDERKRQIEKECFYPSHDDHWHDGELSVAAACYALPDRKRRTLSTIHLGKMMSVVEKIWPWCIEFWKPTPENRIKELAKAGALIAAEIDRLQRLSEEGGKE